MVRFAHAVLGAVNRLHTCLCHQIKACFGTRNTGLFWRVAPCSQQAAGRSKSCHALSHFTAHVCATVHSAHAALLSRALPTVSKQLGLGSFGELPPAASKQLGVVNACGHHLLNMINMARDMLRGLDGGDWDLSTSKVQVSTPIDEVGMQAWARKLPCKVHACEGLGKGLGAALSLSQRSFMSFIMIKHTSCGSGEGDPPSSPLPPLQAVPFSSSPSWFTCHSLPKAMVTVSEPLTVTKFTGHYL
eukprot:419481-Pelagomonas_calceolata.AAC.1